MNFRTFAEGIVLDVSGTVVAAESVRMTRDLPVTS